MANVLVMYFSKYGSTKKYAEWIAAELKGDIYDIKDIRKPILENYSTIILGSALYAGKIKGINTIINNHEMLKNKKLVLFTCGLGDCKKIETVNNINKRLKQIIPENIIQSIKIFYLHGGINYKKLNIKHKIMMGLLKIMTTLKGVGKLNEEDKEFIETYGKTMDFTDKRNILEIIEYCK